MIHDLKNAAGCGSAPKPVRLCNIADANDVSVNCSLIDSILEQSPNPIWISDSKGTLIKINRACADLLTISETEVVGVYNILNDNIVRDQGFLPLVQRVYEKGETARFEIRYDSSELAPLQLNQHAQVILDVTIFAISDARHNVTNAVIQHIDITSRRQSEEALQRANAELEGRVRERTSDLTALNEALRKEIAERKLAEEALLRSEQRYRESEQLFRTLCAAAPVGIYMANAEGSCIYSNPRLQELNGLSAEEGLGWGWIKSLHPEDQEETRAEWRAAVGAEAIFQHEFRLLVKGEPVWIRALARPFKGPGGAIAGYVGIVEDITEQLHAREELLKTQKLEALGVLAGGIAHDFNNILSIILGYISLARSKANDPEVVLSRLRDGERGVMRARDLTLRLLTFARGGDPVKKTVRLNELLREAADFGSLGSNVRCELILTHDPLLVSADEGQLSQVVHNLVINATQAMPDGGTITIRSESDLSPAEAVAKFSISDAGTGISEQHMAKIFDPYFTTKQGSGLGLTSCYAIIKKHGGTLTVDSVLGEGSTFTVCLPACRQQSVPEPVVQLPERRGAGRILVMDDDALVREVTEAMLVQLGYSADCVADGAAAVEHYRGARGRGETYAAVIMDLTIRGGMGGKEAIGLLLDIDQEVKAVVSSGYSVDPVLANCRDYGFSSVLAKPYSKHDLSRVLHELLGR